MAVVQISRIQLRRGKENSGSGLPQLASGELAWAIDTQKLYIGNGSVGEGAPAVGNTRLLTEVDNLLDYGTYIYKDGDSIIQTGADTNYPIVRTLQERLDDVVSAASYGIVSGSSDQTEAIQRAVDNLFFDNAVTGSSSRVTLVFGPGEYSFASTIYLPSYVNILGAGKQKTIFNFTGTSGTAFSFMNDTATKLNRAGDTPVYNEQAKFCSLVGFTVNTNQPDVLGFNLSSVRDSVFEDIEITGNYDRNDLTISENSIAIGMYTVSSIVTCQRNSFKNLKITGFNYAVYAQEDIFNNHFDRCEVIDSRYGFNFGDFTMNPVKASRPVRFQYGPRKNIIENCYFNNIDREGIIVTNGYGNKSLANTFVNVGNNGGGNASNAYAQIRFIVNGNSSNQDNFDRNDPFDTDSDLAQNNFSTTYKKEISGKGNFISTETRTVNVTHSPSSFANLFRIPFTGSSGFEITYTLESAAYTQMRRGKILVSVDADTSTVQLVDDYEYTGTSGQDSNIKLSASIVSGCVMITCKNTNSNDTTLNPAKLTYSYSTIS